MDSFDISEWAEDHSEDPTASKLFPQDKLADIKKCAFLAAFSSKYLGCRDALQERRRESRS